MGSDDKIDTLIAQLAQKKGELEESIRIRKEAKQENELLCSFHSEDNKEGGLFGDNRLKEYNDYFENNDLLFDYDCKEAQSFLDRIF